MSEFSKDVYPELWMLAEAYVEGRATPEQMVELETRVDGDEEAMRFFVAWMDQHAALQWQMRDGVVRNPPADGEKKQSGGSILTTLADSARGFLKQAHSNPQLYGFVMLLGVISLMIVLGTTLWLQPSPPKTPLPVSTPTAVARITRSEDAKWTVSGRVDLMPGARLEVESGLVELRYASGARVLVEGPAEFILTGVNEGRLKKGKLTAVVPPPATGFSVDTPQLKIVDLGTEFGVGVREDGTTELAVFRGEVRAEPADSRIPACRIKTGTAFRIDAAATQLQPVSAAGLEFTRELSKPPATTAIEARKENARLADTDGDDKGDRIFRAKKAETLAIGEGQKEKRAQREGRYWLPFKLTDAQRGKIASAAKVELRVRLADVSGAKGYRVDVYGLGDRKSLDASKTDYEAEAVLLAKGIFRDTSEKGKDYSVDVTEFVRKEAAKPGSIIALRLQVDPKDLPQDNNTSDCFLVVPAGKEASESPALIVTEGEES